MGKIWKFLSLKEVDIGTKDNSPKNACLVDNMSMIEISSIICDNVYNIMLTSLLYVYILNLNLGK